VQVRQKPTEYRDRHFAPLETNGAQRWISGPLERGRRSKIGAMHSPNFYPLETAARARLRPQERGFSLLEVLISIVVLSFGVLGVVGMQAAALQANKEARNQSTAVRLGRELGDMMRGNKDVAIATGGANPYLVANFTGSASTAPEDCSTGPCSSPTAVAQFQMSDWLSRVEQELPGARVVVCVDSTPYNAGIPQWACTGTGGLIVVKIGWTRQSTNRGATGTAALDRATGTNSRPSVVLPLIPGSDT
jgi:type IV pilus assembly protein PilV